MMCWDKNIKIQYCVGIISLPRLLLCNGVPMCGCKPPNFPTMMCNESVMVVRIWKLHSMRIFVPYLITLLWTNWIWGTTPSSPASLHHTCALCVITWSRVIILPGFLPKREYWTLSRADISVVTLRRMLDNCSGTDFSWKEMLVISIWFFAGRMEAYSFFYLSMSVWKFVLMYNITHWVIIFLAASLTCLQIDFTWLAVTHTDSLTGTHLRPQYQHNNAMVMTSAEWSLVKIDSWWTITVGFMMYLKISCPPHMLALMSLTVKY